ncbi:hypothetical protein TrRE_jg2694 [Triparma retinervis]|uniref:Transmembrane protein n=1 Tax=Triparma retinervis TaxID=2557542 RepID=A0A9W6Z809_9STRA|nr:hypothetical protein TrRE_jg2694 [Triparma retinervis]
MNSRATFLLLAVLGTLLSTVSAFSPLSFVPSTTLKQSNVMTRARLPELALSARGSKGGTKREDLSAIETRDMTRQEMLDYNKESEDIMNSELTLMTGFSLLVSVPILYLCWVAYFSD